MAETSLAPHDTEETPKEAVAAIPETALLGELTKPLEGVFYTDGGCRAAEPGQAASRGHAGWGIHGYLYTKEEPKTGAGAKKGVPTHRGYDNKASGKGSITVHAYIDECHSVLGEGTNNLGELLAAIRAFELAMEHQLKSFTLAADSKLILDGIEKYMPQWRKRDFIKADGTPVVNKDKWQRLSDLMQQYEDFGGTVHCKWVKGHSGDLGNELADRYARRGVLSRRENKPVAMSLMSPAKGYWKNDYDRQRLLNLANWYFTVSGDMDVKTKDGRHIYYMGDIRESEEFFGKRISDATFAVVYLKDEEPMLTQLREQFTQLAAGTMQGLIVADLKTIFASDMYHNLATHGTQFMLLNRQRQSIEHMDSVRLGDEEVSNLAHEIRPTRLAYAGIQEMEHLEKVLHDYLHPRLSSRMRSTEITDVLYERTESKGKISVKLRPTIGSTTRYLDTEVAIYTAGFDVLRSVRLTLGQDLPDRNTLAAIAAADIKVTVVTWPESAMAYRFATIIEVDGNAGIWSGPYANLNLLGDITPEDRKAAQAREAAEVDEIMATYTPPVEADVEGQIGNLVTGPAFVESTAV